MSYGTACTWVQERGGWHWSAENTVKDLSDCSIGITPKSNVLCIGDGLFHGLRSHSRCKGILESLKLAVIECDGLQHLCGATNRRCGGLISVPHQLHTLVLSVGTTELREGYSPEQVRDGILQLAERFAQANYEEMVQSDDVRPQQIIIFGVSPGCYGVPGSDTLDDSEQIARFNRACEELNQMLEESTSRRVFEWRYPFLASLLMLGALRVQTKPNTCQPHLHSSSFRLNSRGQGVLLQRLLHNVLFTWPGGNPPKDIDVWVKQLGLDVEAEAAALGYPEPPKDVKERLAENARQDAERVKLKGVGVGVGVGKTAAAQEPNKADAGCREEEGASRTATPTDEFIAAPEMLPKPVHSIQSAGGPGKSWASIAATVLNPTAATAKQDTTYTAAFTKLRGMRTVATKPSSVIQS